VALSKGERFERIVEKAAELGAATFVPMITARSLGVERGQRLDRWQRLARESSALAGRSRWMEVAAPRTFKSIVTEESPGVLFTETPLPREKGGVPRRQEAPLWLLIGPEGGFTDDEVELALDSNWRAAGLGPRNLRVETAAVVALTVALFENGEFEVVDR
jgi:16S rRNA (uracil1498-N3)-methyltransferase